MQKLEMCGFPETCFECFGWDISDRNCILSNSCHRKSRGYWKAKSCTIISVAQLHWWALPKRVNIPHGLLGRWRKHLTLQVFVRSHGRTDTHPEIDNVPASGNWRGLFLNRIKGAYLLLLLLLVWFWMPCLKVMSPGRTSVCMQRGELWLWHTSLSTEL